MTARLFIIRGSFIIAWFFYNFMSNLLIDHRLRFRIDFILIFGLISLVLGFLLQIKITKIKIDLALVLSVMGLILSLWGIYQGIRSFKFLLADEIYFSLKATSSLFFGGLLAFLYLKSLRELFLKKLSWLFKEQ